MKRTARVNVLAPFLGRLRLAFQPVDERMVRAQTNMNRESRIRPMVEADAEVVAELATELGYPNEIEAIRRRIRPIREADLLLVATDGSDKPVGFIQAHRVCIIEVGFRVEILGLVVSSIARRKGIAQMLIGEAELWAKKIGAEVVSVRSNTRRAEAHLFYPTMGYKQIKTQAVYEKRTGGSEEQEARRK